MTGAPVLQGDVIDVFAPVRRMFNSPLPHHREVGCAHDVMHVVWDGMGWDGVNCSQQGMD